MALGAERGAGMPLCPLGSKLPWTCPPSKELLQNCFFAASAANSVSISAFDVVCSQLGFVHAGVQADVATSVF